MKGIEMSATASICLFLPAVIYFLFRMWAALRDFPIPNHV